ncbi:MAG: hypothetical protein ACXWV2_01195 [Chitinophagaceae bacterium]
MNTELLKIIPVLPSADIARDISWYKEKVGFETHFSDRLYSVLYRENLVLHLQWHANTANDPLPGGSVIRINVNNIQPLFEEFLKRGTITQDALKLNTPWSTNEFGFYDLNGNAIFIMEDNN